MVLRRLLPALVVVALVSTPSAAARTITADTEREVCMVSDSEDSSVLQFWDELEGDVRDARLTEFDEVDPGLKQAIEDYIADDPNAASPQELQQRITDTGSAEGLAMLLPEENEQEVGDAASENQYKTEYTLDEAQSTVDAITDDPAAGVAEQLRDAATGYRVDEIRADLFAQRMEDYNATQFELRDEFQNCIDEIMDARPIPLQYLILGGAVILALVALGLRAWSNSKKPDRHGRR